MSIPEELSVTEEPGPDRSCTRRGFLREGAGLMAAGAAASWPLNEAGASARQGSLPPSNGGKVPFPIPWLDKNGNRNQPAGPQMEPSHIYDFKGRVARCAGFTGMGADNKGNRIAFGTPTTDFGIMQGEYWAAREPQKAEFTHI